ncbi:hypothetical protein F5Y05DRAFT_409232 [Hypoxylon sp. FL0543]|nr:hypothetical protein F5Y05DRAFT_409232 [Hypoxylon sp. FL0543]
MTYTVVAHIKRKTGTTPEQFRNYYDTVHIPLLMSLVGPTFPLTHTRNYVTRKPKDLLDPNTKFEPIMYMGEATSVEYDSLTVMVWEDKAAFDRFAERFYSKEVHEKMTEDEKNFADPAPRVIYAIEEPRVTKRGETLG